MKDFGLVGDVVIKAMEKGFPFPLRTTLFEMGFLFMVMGFLFLFFFRDLILL